MKKIFCFVLLSLSFWSIASERILLQDSKTLMAEINANTLRCSAIGYGATELKINLKGLDGWTILDHSNARFGEFNGEPCMTAGRCKEFSENGFDLDQILQTHSGSEKVIVYRTLQESKYPALNHQGEEVCHREVSEILKAKIAGIDFDHRRSFTEVFTLRACQ